jgi:hypothetical protein
MELWIRGIANLSLAQKLLMHIALVDAVIMPPCTKRNSHDYRIDTRPIAALPHAG